MTSYLRTPMRSSVPLNSERRDNGWIMTWNRVSFLELGSYATAPRSARWHTSNVLRDWGLEKHEEVTQLIVSELVTNSVLAAGAHRWVEVPPVRLWLLGDSSRVLSLVWDALPGTPLPRRAGDDDESGRGLFLVQQLSAAWGSYRPPSGYAPEHDGGKVTWAIIGTREGEKR